MGALQGEWAGWWGACSSVRLVALADLWGASGVWDLLASASVGVAASAGHGGALTSAVAVVATCVGEGVQWASVGWDGAGRAVTRGVLVEMLQAFGGVQFEVAWAWSLASSEGAAGAHSPAEADSLVGSEVAAGSHFASVLGMPAGTVEEHQAAGAYIHEGSRAGSGGEGRALVQADSPEAAVAPWPGGSAVDVSAAGVGVQEFGLGLEAASLVGA